MAARILLALTSSRRWPDRLGPRCLGGAAHRRRGRRPRRGRPPDGRRAGCPRRPPSPAAAADGAPAGPSPRSPPATAPCPTNTAKSGGNTTSAPTPRRVTTHQTARTGHRRLDPAGDRLRGLARRAAGHPQRHAADAPRLSHAADAGRRGRRRRSLRRQRGRRRQTFSLRVMTIDSPNWRVRAQRVLQPVPVQTPGVSAWLLAEGRRRRAAGRSAAADRLPRAQLAAPAGQQRPIDRRFGMLRPRTYVRDVSPRPDVWPRLRGRRPARSTRASPWSSARCCRLDRRTDRRHDQVQHRPGGEADAGDRWTFPRRRCRGSGRRSTCRRCRTSASTSGSAGRPTRCC